MNAVHALLSTLMKPRSSLLDFQGSLEFAGWDAGQGVSSR